MIAYLNGYRVGERTATQFFGYGPGACLQCLVQGSPQAKAIDGPNDSLSLTLRIPSGMGGSALAALGACTEVGAGTPPAANIALVTRSATGYPTITPIAGAAKERWPGTNTAFNWITPGSTPTINDGDIVTIKLWPRSGAYAPGATLTFDETGGVYTILDSANGLAANFVVGDKITVTGSVSNNVVGAYIQSIAGGGGSMTINAVLVDEVIPVAATITIVDPDATNYFNGYRPKALTTTLEFPRCSTTSVNLVGTDTAADSSAYLAFKLANGNVFGLPAAIDTTIVATPYVPISASFGPTAAIRKRGMYFVPRKTMEFDAIICTFFPAAINTAFAFQLCGADGTTVLKSEQFADSEELSPGASSVFTSIIPLSSKWMVLKGQVYYLWLADVGGAANSYQTVYYRIPDAASRTAFEGLEECEDAEISSTGVITRNSLGVPWLGFRVSAIYGD